MIMENTTVDNSLMYCLFASRAAQGSLLDAVLDARKCGIELEIVRTWAIRYATDVTEACVGA